MTDKFNDVRNQVKTVITNFIQNREAYLVVKKQNDMNIEEVTIKNIGRKYVTLKNDNKYAADDNGIFTNVDNFSGYNYDKRLFPCYEMADLYLKKANMIKELRNMISFYNYNSLSLEELESILSILKNKQNIKEARCQ